MAKAADQHDLGVPSGDARADVGSDRREFLCKIGALASAGALAPLVVGCESAEVFGPEPVAGVKLDFDITKEPFKPLADVGGKAKTIVGGTPIVMVRTTATQVLAFKDECPHKQCPLSATGSWDTGKKQLSCGCHGAVFDATGKAVSWPKDGTTQTNLKAFKVTFASPTGTVQA